MSAVASQSPASRLFTQPFNPGRSKKTFKLSVTGLCAGNSPATGEFPTQRASNAKNVYIWGRHHVEYLQVSSVKNSPWICRQLGTARQPMIAAIICTTKFHYVSSENIDVPLPKMSTLFGINDCFQPVLQIPHWLQLSLREINFVSHSAVAFVIMQR